MKTSYFLIAISSLLPLAQTLAQNLAQTPGPYIIASPNGPSEPQPELTRFDLDFPGGTPSDLVAAIQRAMHRPLNAIVPDEYDDIRVPAVKMSHVS